jgi:hypothetical protein
MQCSHARRKGFVASYAVAWSEEGAATQIGKLEFPGGGIRLESGRRRDGHVSVRHVAFRDLLGAEMAPVRERIGHRPTIALRSVHGVIALAPAGVGAALEVLDMLRAALPEIPS